MESEERMRELFRDLVEEGRAEGQQTEIVHPQITEVPFRVNEALNVLRGNIQLSGNNIKAIAITSALAHEGKSSIAFRLAKNMAGLEKRILYMDCDIRNSTTMKRYEITGKKEGLSEYLCGRTAKEKIIYHTDDKYMDILFTGAIAPNPSELVSGPLFTELMTFVKSIYDYIIVDTPPLNVVIDGLLIAKQCDGAVLVVESGLTERAQAEKAKQQLTYAGVKILGAVLNKADAAGKRYGYGYGYGGYYGYGYYGYGHRKDQEDGKSGKKKKWGKEKRQQPEA
jgi:capsular exopolysaccharide synthesis family protein